MQNVEALPKKMPGVLFENKFAIHSRQFIDILIQRLTLTATLTYPLMKVTGRLLSEQF